MPYILDKQEVYKDFKFLTGQHFVGQPDQTRWDPSEFCTGYYVLFALLSDKSLSITGWYCNTETLMVCNLSIGGGKKQVIE